MRPRGHAVAAGGVAPFNARGRPPGPLVATGIAVGIVAISTSPILVREAHVPALALAFWRCLAGALLLAPVASSTVLVACSPLFVGVLAGPLLGEPPSRLGWAGIGLTIAGAALIAL